MGFKFQFLLCTFVSVLFICRQIAAAGQCNLFHGQWVYDPSSYPLYNSSTCPFIDPMFDCQKFGRPDRGFLKYSWKPNSCNLPRFDGANLLRRLRGKKIMFVGDSISLNQWSSLVCLLHAAVPNARTTFEKSPITYVKFEEYDVTILWNWSPFLVDIVQEPRGRVLNLNSIEQGKKAWRGMDVLVFDTWHWWTFNGTAKIWDYVRDGSTVRKDMNRVAAFYKGLRTWARWVNTSVDSSRTKLFFQGISPDHYWGHEWGSRANNCAGEQQPVKGARYPAGRPEAAKIVDKVSSRLRKAVHVLDITTMSQLRKDAHPSIYNQNHSGSDCTHWCLPGLPDTWNQLFYAALV
ncbi:hypothetical protein ACJIZ3_022590 [Penstemon smallii]|uniref:Trichome birefringence-like N-terminal domain-containing protein n=1 Tax=Penstemon smallii TaxID=265156 RepID=A0ABD3TLN4_9LAMI